MIEAQLKLLAEQRARDGGPAPTLAPLPNGSYLVTVPEVAIDAGWNRANVNVLFVAPPGYPASQPDCFWVEPGGLRLANGSQGQASNDGNAIPGDPNAGRSLTWFSWHLQMWNPNRDTLLTYFNVIMDRLKPAR